MADYGLELLAACGVSEITAVVCPADVEAVRRLCDLSPWGEGVRIVVQPEPKGTADALGRCASHVTQNFVATLWGDNLYEHVPADSCASFVEHGRHSQLHVTHAEHPEHFSTVETSAWTVSRVIDKPPNPSTTTVATGLMLFNATALFEALPRVTPNARGERDVMDCVREFTSAAALRAEPIHGYWLDAAVSPHTLETARHFAATRGFNHPSTAQKVKPWTSTAPLPPSESFWTLPGAAS